MAEMTLKDVIERLKTEGDLVRNSGTNSIKAMKEVLNVISETIIDQTSILKELLELSKKTFEIQERRDKLGIAEKTVIGGDPVTDTESVKVKKQSEELLNVFQELVKRLAPLGLAIGTAALGIGTAIGAVKGYIDAIKLFFPTITRFITGAFNNFIRSIGVIFTNFTDTIRTNLRNVSANIFRVFDNLFDWVRNTFSATGQSRLSRAVTAFSNGIRSLVRPFVDLGKMIGDLLKGPLNAIRSSFNNLLGFLGRFGGAITAVANIARRIFLPLTIIMTAFDTIKGALDGLAEGGVLGAFKGAIDGFVTSLITKPLDFIKDMVAWIADKLGFDKSAAFLRDFSFTDLWKKLTDTIFNFIDKIIDTALNALPNWAKKILGIEERGVDNTTRIQNEIADLRQTKSDLQKQAEFDAMSSGVYIEPDTSRIDKKIEENTSQLAANVTDPLLTTDALENISTATAERKQYTVRMQNGNLENLTKLEVIKGLRDGSINRADSFTKVAREKIRMDSRQDLRLGAVRAQELPNAVGPLAPSGMLQDISMMQPENINEIEQYLANTQSPAQVAAISNLNTVSQLATQQQMAPQVTVNAPTIAPVTNSAGGTNISNNSTTNISTGVGSGMGRFAN